MNFLLTPYPDLLELKVVVEQIQNQRYLSAFQKYSELRPDLPHSVEKLYIDNLLNIALGNPKKGLALRRISLRLFPESPIANLLYGYYLAWGKNHGMG